MLALPGTGSGSKPCEVGREERIRAWFRTGTWKTAQPRGTKSHLMLVCKLTTALMLRIDRAAA